MSWRPPYARAADAHDPRLDPYRDRGAILSDGEGVVGRMYVQIQTWWNQAGGRLWWKRWSKPYEVPYGLMNSRLWGWDDWVGSPDDLDQDLADWAQTGSGIAARGLSLSGSMTGHRDSCATT